MKTKIDISLCGNEEDIIKMLRVLSVIRHYCVRGCSRTIKIHIDGDGSANLYAARGDEIIDEFPAPKDKLGDVDDFEIYIGE